MIKLTLATLLLGAAAATAQPLAAAAPAAEGYSTERLARLAPFMRGVTGPDGYLGGVTLVVRHGHVVEWQAYGKRDLARSLPMARDSIFRIYSMTKTVTTVAALILMEEGRLGLDDPVGQYLPAFKDLRVFSGGSASAPVTRAAVRPITIHNLLTHTAGFATGGTGFEVPSGLLDRQDLHDSTALKDYAARVAAVPLATDPGTRFAYDGVNIEVLARVIEVASGMPFDAFVQQRILAPLAMHDTGWSVPATQRHRIVDITTMGTDGRLVRAEGRSSDQPGEPLDAYPSGAGGLYSTASDFARFCQMLLNGGTLGGHSILGRKTVELMMMNHLTQLDLPVTSFSPAEGFGLGGSVVIDVARNEHLGSLGAFGWRGAASTYFSIDTKEQMISILLLQHLPVDQGPDLPLVSARFYNIVYQALVP